MLQMENRVEIEVLHRQGKGIREIARITGLARNTVREVTKGRSDGVYGPRKPRATKLDAHKEFLAARIAQAGDVRLNATVLLRELSERGYSGGITQLKEYLRTIRPAVEPEPVIRFETPPGKQLQVDFVVFRRGEMPYGRSLLNSATRDMRSSSSPTMSVQRRF